MTVFELLKRVGLYSLISNDGCACGSLELQGVRVRVSCGRGSEGAIRIYRTLDIPLVDLAELGAEVKRQVDDAYGRDLPVVFETYEDSREYRAFRAWQQASGKPKYEDFLKAFEVHGKTGGFA